MSMCRKHTSYTLKVRLSDPLNLTLALLNFISFGTRFGTYTALHEQILVSDFVHLILAILCLQLVNSE